LNKDAEEEMREKKRTRALKYTEYRIKTNIMVGKLKNRLIEMVLEEDDARKDLLHARFLEELQCNIVPVVKDRTFKRENKTKQDQ
jgi:formyltetrahydrofolate hydrolase